MGLCACNSAGHLANHADIAPNHAGITFAISNTIVRVIVSEFDRFPSTSCRSTIVSIHQSLIAMYDQKNGISYSHFFHLLRMVGIRIEYFKRKKSDLRDAVENEAREDLVELSSNNI